METLTNIEIIKKLQENNMTFFTLADFSRLFNIINQDTIYKKIQRLEEKGIIKKIIKGKYLFLLRKIQSAATAENFMIANFLYQPSYISLESALSFWGISTGFPYNITSVTTQKTKLFIFNNKSYQYTHFDAGLFWGYEKKEDFLLADREKALLDFLYLAFKGLRIFDIKNKSDFDFSSLNKKKFKKYLKNLTNSSFINFIRRIKL